MNNKILYSGIGVILGLIVGYYVFGILGYTIKSFLPQEAPQTNTASHAHAMLEVDPSNPIPSVQIEAIKDTKDGYNIRLTTTHFTWAPERVGGHPIPGEGHAHLYVNGVKVGRLYADWYHLGADKLNEGRNEISVTLNANNHGEWTRNGAHIDDSITVVK